MYASSLPNIWQGTSGDAEREQGGIERSCRPKLQEGLSMDAFGVYAP